MFGSLKVVTMATDLSKHAAMQQALVSRNIANIDTPNYQAQHVPELSRDPGAAKIMEMRRTDSRHFLSFDASTKSIVAQSSLANMKPNGNSVSLEVETLKSIEAERLHSRAMAIYQSSLNILRASIGRGR